MQHLLKEGKAGITVRNTVMRVKGSIASPYQFTIEDINASDWETIKTV